MKSAKPMKKRFLAMLLSMAMVVTMMPTTAFAQTLTEPYKLAGTNYITDEHGLMGYCDTNVTFLINDKYVDIKGFDIKGLFDQTAIGTTCENCGYSTYLKTGETITPVYAAKEPQAVGITNLQVGVDFAFQNEGKTL